MSHAIAVYLRFRKLSRQIGVAHRCGGYFNCTQRHKVDSVVYIVKCIMSEIEIEVMEKRCVHLALPVLNEELQLQLNVEKIIEVIQKIPDYTWTVSIVDNGSTDSTPALGEELASKYRMVDYVRIEERGRGNALKCAFMKHRADVYMYMDIDLSTDLRHLEELLGLVASGECDIAIGARLDRRSDVKRSYFRTVISLAYNGIVRMYLGTRIRDLQCGFKAISGDVVAKVLPSVMNRAWFFDTELLCIAERMGFRIVEVPVRWIDDKDSRVRICQTNVDNLREMVRLRRSLEKVKKRRCNIML